MNAMAVAARPAATLIDPHGGSRGSRGAAAARRRRSARSRDDPLRTMRMARFACELGFEVDPATRRLGRRRSAAHRARSPPSAASTSCAADRSARIRCAALELMDDAGLVRELLPELEALKGVEQNPYHHLDVWGHTLEVLGSCWTIERDPGGVFGAACARRCGASWRGRSPTA